MADSYKRLTYYIEEQGGNNQGVHKSTEVNKSQGMWKARMDQVEGIIGKNNVHMGL